jgi:cytochrome b subunit of formate dehydrogenase
MAKVFHEVQRFSRLQRIEHWGLTLSFTVLGLTGIPQKFAGAEWAEVMIALMGGIETLRIIHRLAAIVLMLVSISHIVSVAYKIFVQRAGLSMLPRPKDAVDLLDMIRYNLGLAQGRPRLDRFGYEEKAEYWAVIWGTLIMVATGFALWNPIATTRFLPGDFIPAAKAAHGGEALLAILAIITWHVYNVHLKTFNKSMFTGKLSREKMLHEHPLELLRLESSPARPPVRREVIRRRERLFVPFASILVVVLLIGLWQFVTFEQTAVATVPRHEQAAIFVPFTPTPPPTATPSPGPTATAIPVIPPGVTVEAGLPGFRESVLPILESNCGKCHGGIAGLTITSYDSLMHGGVSGPPIAPGYPEGSLIVRKLQGPHAGQLSPSEMALLKAWIATGAPDN